MSFLSGIGHFLGNIFGDDDEEKKKKQQQAPKKVATVAPPRQSDVLATITGQQPDNGVKLYNGAPQKVQNQPQPNQPTPQPARTDVYEQPLKKVQQNPQPQPAKPAEPGLGSKVWAGLKKKVAPAVGAGAGVGRAAIGLGEGVLETPSVIAHGTNAVANKISGAEGVPSYIKKVDKVTGYGNENAPLKKLGKKTDELATSFGPRATETYKPAQVLTNVATLAPGAAEGIATGLSKVKQAKSAVPLLRKIGDPVEDVASEGAAVAEAAEVAPGIRSANPNQAEDAAAHAAQQAEEQARQRAQATQQADLRQTPEVTPDNQPAYQRPGNKQSSTGEQPTQATPLDRPSFMHKRDIQGVVDKGNQELDDWVANNQGAGLAEIEAAKESIKKQVGDEIEKLQAVRQLDREAPAETPPAPAVEAPAVPDMTPPPVATETPLAPSEVVPEIPAPVTNPAVEAAAAPIGPAPATVADAPGAVAVAPRTHDALVKQLGDAGRSLKGQYDSREPLNLEDLRQTAKATVANISDEDLVRSFNTIPTDEIANSPEAYALAREALGRLGQRAGDPEAEQTVINILNGMDAYSSKSGLGLRVVQEDFDTLPLPMKVRYIVKTLDNANKDNPDWAPLADDPARAALVEAQITAHLKASEAIAEKVAAVEGRLNAVADQAKAGAVTTEDVGALRQQLLAESRNLEANNGELAKYYQTMVPRDGLGSRANGFARNMMLGSFSGRVNDVLTTTGNLVNLGAQNITQGLLAKAVNLFKPGAATDTLRGVKQFGEGTAEGIRRGGAEFGDTQYAGDLQKALQSNTGARSGLKKSTNPILRGIQAATEFATRASEGAKSQRLYQLAVKEGQQSGLDGDLLKQYAEARSAVPSRQMEDAATRLHEEVNNLNDNPISRGLGRIAQALEPSGVPDSALGKVGQFGGGLIRNQILPFTSWLGGNIWNTVTDRNVVANLVKLVQSAQRGDVDGITANLAKFANNAAASYGLGYLMTQHGLITNADAQGYNDAGAYLHIGDRYIPVGFLGAVAPNIILGNATYHGINNNGGGSTAEAIAASAGQSILNMAKAVNVAGALGADNTIARTINAVEAPNSKVSAADAGAAIAGNAVGQYIPAITGDVNAVLNQTNLNPTHEAPLTKVTKKSAAGNDVKDYKASAVASLESRIPGVSQGMPRKAGVAAPDLIDRTTHGNRDTKTSKDTRLQKVAQVDRATSDKKNDIPNPEEKNFDTAIEAHVQDGKYDKAIEGWKQKIDLYNKDRANTPKSKIKDAEDEIKTLEVLEKGKYKPEVRDLYKKTSLSEWRNMGDPDNENYDQKTYDLLYQYDSELAKAGVSRSSLSADKNLYSAKQASKGKGGGDGLSKIKSNTLGDAPGLGKVDFGNLKPQKITDVSIPQIPKVKAGDLIKKRKISVGKGF